MVEDVWNGSVAESMRYNTGTQRPRVPTSLFAIGALKADNLCYIAIVQFDREYMQPPGGVCCNSWTCQIRSSSIYHCATSYCHIYLATEVYVNCISMQESVPCKVQYIIRRVF